MKTYPNYNCKYLVHVRVKLRAHLLTKVWNTKMDSIFYMNFRQRKYLCARVQAYVRVRTHVLLYVNKIVNYRKAALLRNIHWINHQLVYICGARAPQIHELDSSLQENLFIQRVGGAVYARSPTSSTAKILDAHWTFSLAVSVQVQPHHCACLARDPFDIRPIVNVRACRLPKPSVYFPVTLSEHPSSSAGPSEDKIPRITSLHLQHRLHIQQCRP